MAGSLVIGQFSIAAEARGPLERRDRQTRVIERLTKWRLRQALQRRMPDAGDDQRVFVLDQLKIELDDVSGGDLDAIADRLADGVALAVARLAGEGVFGRSCCFDSPAARDAALVLALARGECVHAWRFAAFANLQHLPVSSAIAVVLRREPTRCLAILATLDELDRAAVLQALSRIDAQIVQATLIPAPSEISAAEVWGTVFSQLSERFFASSAHARLAALTQLYLVFGSEPDAVAHTAVKAKLAIDAVLRRAGRSAASVAVKLAAAIAARDSPQLRAMLKGLSVTDLATLLALPDPILKQIVVAIQVREAAPATSVLTIYSRFGGLLMLIPHWPEHWADSLADGPGQPANFEPFLGLAALAGPVDSGAVINDPALRAAFLIDSRTSEAELADWLKQAIPAKAHESPPARDNDFALPRLFHKHRRGYQALRAAAMRAVDGFARSLIGFDRASLGFLRSNLLSAGALITVEPDRIHVLLDRPKLDVLLAISGLGDRTHRLGDGRVLELERRR